MAAILRSRTIRVLLASPRLTAQSICRTQPLCRVPPETPEQSGEAEVGATEEKLQKSQNVETQTNHEPPQETEDKKNGKSEVAATAKEEAALPKQKESSVKKTPAQKKLHDLLSSLARTDPIPVQPRVQLSGPKARKKKTKAPAKITPVPAPEPLLEPELVAATKEVAESLGGDVKETESELLSTLRLHSSETTASAAPSISDLFAGMKVERKPKSKEVKEPSHLPYNTEVGHPRRFQPQDQTRPSKFFPQPSASSVSRTRVDLFGSEPMDIFNKKQENTSEPPATTVLPTWESLYLHELQQSISHPPSNAFVEMIQWTNEGKLWSFPIDNETGLEKEKKVGFHEHIFLERHLEGWCPQRGPIRHFMELVCTGLSKNPYLTVERKQAHIEWYKNYFSQKEELLKELGAIEVSQ